MSDKVTKTTGRRFVAQIASGEAEVLESLRLRYRVFAEELGAKLETAPARIDADHFDQHCSHLIVRDTLTQRIVASTRLLSESGARAAGGYYSESEFDLSCLSGLRGRKLEIGRTCVDPQYRNGAVIATLWSKLVEYVIEDGHDYLFGCASISLDDGGEYAHSVMEYLTQKYLAPPEQRVRSRHRLPAADFGIGTHATSPRLPPLLKAYVGLGARICGEGYWDQDFNCVDVFVLLDMDKLSPRYARHFKAPAVTESRFNHAA